MSNKWLQNKSFIQWRLFPTEEDHLYWESFIRKNPDLKDEIDQAIEILKSIKLNTQKLSPEEKQNIFELIQKDIYKRKKQKRFRMYLTLTATACIILFVLFFRLPVVDPTESVQEEILTSVPNAVVNEKDIQLLLSDDQTMTFEDDANIQYNKHGEIIVDSGNEQIKTQNTQTEEEKLNTLIVPKGKRSNITLADGTKVWVNSGSTLKFPAYFKADKREIWIDGEIYLEVEKNTEQPFYVNSSRMVIEVTGTRFNVTAYNEDEDHAVVLVEGGVDINVMNVKIPLKPDHMLSVTPDGTSTKKVNIYDYISWKDGLLQFTSEPLSTVLTRLSRYYDIPITYEEQVKNMRCNGKLVLFDNIRDVLETIYNTVPIKYTIENEHITIQKR